ncbi:MAG: hypothetical protein ACN2B6_12205 [Rickettsiales bacterium]
MIELIKSLFSGSGVVKSIESIASEYIQTDLETAEAKTLMIKTLDPNVMMRRELSRSVTKLYTIYVLTTAILLIGESFGVGSGVIDPATGKEVLSVSLATSKLTDLFTPITTLFGVIVSASFGVNCANTIGGK